MEIFKVDKLSHSFGGLKAVFDFNLIIDNSDIWGIIGPNGAGKTTTFNLFTGVYKPDKGKILLKGEDITGLPSNEIIAKGISRTFQNIRLFKSMTVMDNVKTSAYSRMGYRLAGALFRTAHFKNAEKNISEASIAILEKFGLANRANALATSLSYGMQRKVELARALVSEPSLLLLDEPGAGMNPSELDDLGELVLWIKEKFGVAIILIEHRMRLVMKLCEHVKVLDFGKTIFDGEPAKLADDSTVVKAYFGEDHADAFC